MYKVGLQWKRERAIKLKQFQAFIFTFPAFLTLYYRDPSISKWRLVKEVAFLHCSKSFFLNSAVNISSFIKIPWNDHGAMFESTYECFESAWSQILPGPVCND